MRTKKYILLIIAFAFFPYLTNAQPLEKPKKIVSLAPSVTEIIFALGKGENLVGVTMFSDYPKQAKKMVRIGSYIKLDIEKIVALRPDICIGVKDGNPEDSLVKLKKLKILVYTIDPRNLESTAESIVKIGQILGVKDKAKKIASDMKTRIRRVKNFVKTTSKRPKVFFQIDTESIVSVGTDTFINELITCAGGINLSAGAVPYPRFSKEKVVAMAPDVIIITSMGKIKAFERAKANWQKFSTIPAVNNNRIHLASSDILNRPTPRLVDGLELLLDFFHPELVRN